MFTFGQVKTCCVQICKLDSWNSSFSTLQLRPNSGQLLKGEQSKKFGRQKWRK